MPQCDNYPNGCKGRIHRCPQHEKEWFCDKHYFTLTHMRSIGQK